MNWGGLTVPFYILSAVLLVVRLAVAIFLK